MQAKKGMYYDTLLIYSNDARNNGVRKVILKANVQDMPYLQCSDEIDFGNLSRNGIKIIKFGLKNIGNELLEFTNFDLSDTDPQDDKLFDIVSYPEKDSLSTNESTSLEVIFYPPELGTYYDTLLISSNDLKSNGLYKVVLKANVILAPALRANLCDFGEKRVHLKIYDNPLNPHGNDMFPYKLEGNNDENGIIISNIGEIDLEINSAEAIVQNFKGSCPFLIDINSDGKEDGTIIEHLDFFKNNLLKANQENTLLAQVFYHPKEINKDTLIIRILGPVNGDEYYADLHFIGKGVMPHPYFDSHDFENEDNNIILDNKIPITNEIYLVNGTFGDEFVDDLTIYDIFTNDNSMISMSNHVIDNQVFSVDKEQFDFPITVKAKETFKFEAKIHPKKAGNFTADLGFKTDAENLTYYIIFNAEVQNESTVRYNDFNEDFKLSPNPVSNTINLRMPKGNKIIEIIDLQGNKMISLESKADTEVIDILGYENGIYFITIEIDNNIYQEKFVKIN